MTLRKRRERAQTRGQLKKYRVTFVPTFRSVEVEAKSPAEAEELANHYLDMDWDGEFITAIEEIK